MIAKGNYFYKEESVDPTKFAKTDTYRNRKLFIDFCALERSGKEWS